MTATFAAVVLGERPGFLAVAFGYDPYYNRAGKYAHREWIERRYPWPASRDELSRDVEQILIAGERVDVYVCPAVRFTDDRRKGSALPPMVCWADLDGPSTDPDLLTPLEPFTVESGSDGHRHVYVPLRRSVDLGMHARLNKALAVRLGGDAKWSDESLLRLPGTLNYKTNPPAVVRSLPWSGRRWDPDDLAALLGVDPARLAPGVNGSAPVTAEPAPELLPALVRCALEHTDTADRSRAHHRLVGACHDAGLTAGQTLTVVSGYGPSWKKYGERLAEEVARSWTGVHQPTTGSSADRTPWDPPESIAKNAKTPLPSPERASQGRMLPRSELALPVRLDGAEVPPLACEDGGQRPDLLAGLRNGKWLDAQTFPPLSYAVPGIIPEGSTLLVGPPKIGKSWFVLACALAAASGGQALGVLSVEYRPVLYLALEDGDRRLQRRCRILLGSDPIPGDFEYLAHIEPGQVVPTITAWLDRHPGVGPLVILDTLGKVMPVAWQGESAYQRDYRVGSALKRAADEHPGAALLTNHHDRKAVSTDFVDSVSGTHGLAGAADTVVILTRPRLEEAGTLKVTGRDVAEGEYAVTFHTNSTWSLDGATLPEAAQKAATARARSGVGDRMAEVIDYVTGHPAGIGPTDLAKALDIDPKQAQVYLTRAVQSGRLGKVKRGLYAAPRATP